MSFAAHIVLTGKPVGAKTNLLECEAPKRIFIGYESILKKTPKGTSYSLGFGVCGVCGVLVFEDSKS